MGLFTASNMSEDCNKAARILQAMVEKGKIPTEAITNAKGLAIFSCFRAGMYLAGSGGSGVLVARLSDGTWSPPSAFSVRSGGIGLVYGVDMYDCVCVLNTQEAVDAYTKPELSLGGAVAVAAGPMNASNAGTKEIKPVWTYTKSRGLYGGLTVDGTVVKERPDRNEDFYGAKVATAQILRGEVQVQAGASKWPAGAEVLTEVLRLAGGQEVNAAVLGNISTEQTPGDFQD
ncbi:hypothetical protein G7Z17_g3863 [Cylindrodendrum hubeiense]|uniref:Ysc84 actin-binding domain-containing protein n=1 Tax=Cylindrodendrum hubeiense TaxID=595255 RepID=A0A9P5HF11_9HYPO|nr:hypothetical protein G7Z17_g3863 [Cylindrodendrum hubeiense]